MMSIYTLARGSSSGTINALTVGTGNTATIANAVLTNTSSSAIDITVSVGPSGSQTVIAVIKLPAGVGKAKIVKELIGGINSQNIVTFQSSAPTAYNYIIYGKQVAS